MTIPALWTKHRPIALGIAREYRIPGMDPDDIRQEALVALWEACRSYDKEKGPFPPFARLVVKRRLTDQYRRAERRIERRLIEFGGQLAIPVDPDVARERLGEVLEAAETLTPRERRAVADHLNGHRSRVSKAHDQALYRARRKLKAAA